MLKKFRIPRTNPVVWQLGLVEREITEIVRGYLRNQSPSANKQDTLLPSNTTILQKEIGADDICPICQDDLLGTTKRLTYCRTSCGKSLHFKCMRIWADHQKSLGNTDVHCPLCREEFGPIIQQAPDCKIPPGWKDRPHQHLGISCSHCHVCPVVGRCYRCTMCACYHLCHHCFSTNQVHLLHSFTVRKHCSQPWRAVSRPTSPSFPRESPSSSNNNNNNNNSGNPSGLAPQIHLSNLPPTFIQSLQTRSLTESDYELLLALDRFTPQPCTPPASSTSREDRSPVRPGPSEAAGNHHMNTLFPVEPLDRTHPFLVGGGSCELCQVEYVLGDWVSTLPCKHKFHRHCLTDWLNLAHTTCPLDNRPIMPHPQSHTYQHISNYLSTTARDNLTVLARKKLKGMIGTGTRSNPQTGISEHTFGVSGQRLVTRNEFMSSDTNISTPPDSSNTIQHHHHHHHHIIKTRDQVSPTILPILLTPETAVLGGSTSATRSQSGPVAQNHVTHAVSLDEGRNFEVRNGGNHSGNHAMPRIRSLHACKKDSTLHPISWLTRDKNRKRILKKEKLISRVPQGPSSDLAVDQSLQVSCLKLHT